MEVNLDVLRIARQNKLSAVDYHNLMIDRLDEVSDERVKTLGEIERDKLRVAGAYNKKVKEEAEVTKTGYKIQGVLKQGNGLKNIKGPR
jgi:hypothetical protein